MKKQELLNELMDYSIRCSTFIPDEVKRIEVLKMMGADELDKLLYAEASWAPSNHLNYLYARQIFTMVCVMDGVSPKKIRKTIQYWDEL